PRQTGKTWLMREAMAAVRARFGDRFAVGTFSMQGVMIKEGDPEEALLSWVPDLFADAFGLALSPVSTWQEWTDLFRSRHGVFDRPLLPLVDEFDSPPPAVIDRLVGLFRAMYLDRKSYLLHGLALIGVRAVLGVDGRGSPFNVQRSLHVPNLSAEEVAGMFDQ